VYAAVSRSYRVRRFVVFVPQPDPRYVGAVEAFRFDTRELAEAKVAELLEANSYAKDARGWWRLVESAR
jgi:hypothetical protein